MTVSSQTNSTAGPNSSTSLSPAATIKTEESQERPSPDEPEYTLGDYVRIWITGYWASFILTGVMIPIISSATLVALYFSFSDLVTFLSPIVPLNSHSPWHILLLTHFLTLVLWLVIAGVCYPFATAQSANTGSYSLLKARLCQLRAKLRIDGSDHELRMLEKKCGDIKEAIEEICNINRPLKEKIDDCNQTAMTTALASYIDIRKMLYQHPTGLLWAFGSGYCNAWRLLHQAEEAIIEFDCTEEIIHDAMGNKWALQGSAISARDKLLDTLIQAVMVLRPTAGRYFKELQTHTDSVTLAGLKERVFEEFLSHQGIPIQEDSNPAYDEATARSALRQVKRMLNTLRDRSWEGLLRARNRLLASIAITGVVTHVLLCITILSAYSNGIPNSTNHTDLLIAVTAFYLVGAVTGLFGRFYSEWMTGSTVDDFGFSTTRLIATPLLSGLAGIGGVLLTITLTTLGGLALSSSKGQLGLEQIFDLKPQLLLMAAIFGLAPNLLITGLQNTAKKYESDIQSSKIVEPSTANNKAAS